MENNELKVLRKNISLMSDKELIDAMDVSKNNKTSYIYTPQAIMLIKDEILLREKYYNEIKEIQKIKKRFEKIAIHANTNLEELGYKKIKDQISIFKIIGTIFLILCFLSGTIGLFLEKNNNPYKFDYFTFGIITFIISFINFTISKYLRRTCLICKNKMIRLTPDEDDLLSTYKYICLHCHLYIDTGVQRKYKSLTDYVDDVGSSDFKKKIK